MIGEYITREENKPNLWLRNEVLEALDEIPFSVAQEVVFTNPNTYPYWENGDEIAGWCESNTIFIDHRLTEDDFCCGGGSICGMSVLGLVSHEVGHLLMSSVENKRIDGKRVRTIIGQYFQDDKETPSAYSVENRDEYFAEVFALSIVRPNKLTAKQKEMIDLVLWMHEKK